MKRLVAGTMALLLASAIDAAAQSGGTYTGFLTGHLGAVTGGDVSDARGTLGASVSVHDLSGWGAEIDFGRTADARSGRQILDVTSYMVNAVWVRPDGFIRPFGSGGAGILQVNGCDSPCGVRARTYDFGISAGGGAYVALSDIAALRGDLRYFWSSADHVDLRRPDNFNYWRLSVGVTYMWTLVP
ncbi:MAG: porin family protein [Cyanobacteria bacterium]|nr:porin family protein [Cyanobacteriota bacterium]